MEIHFLSNESSTLKKKACINLSEKNIFFEQEGVKKKVILFDPNKMSVELSVREEGKQRVVQILPFAHLPKSIKKLIK